jgi:hypothetical protein
MKFVLKPWHLLAGYANRELQQINDYLRTENAVLRESFGQRNRGGPTTPKPRAPARG